MLILNTYLILLYAVINMDSMCIYYIITPTKYCLLYYLMIKVTDNMTDINILRHGLIKYQAI